MKFSGLDFLSDLEARLLASLAASPRPSAPEFHRVLNFSEKTIVLKIGWLDLPLGTMSCRMVEEPQDFYFRGSFQPSSGEASCPFTLRPGKDYEKDMSHLVEAIAGTAKIGASVSPPAEPGLPAAPAE
jgi:hypothetical protein